MPYHTLKLLTTNELVGIVAVAELSYVYTINKQTLNPQATTTAGIIHFTTIVYLFIQFIFIISKIK